MVVDGGKKVMNKETQLFLLRFCWVAIYYGCIEEYEYVTHPFVDSLSLEEMKERLQELNLGYEGGRYIRLEKLRVEWLKACDEFLSMK